MCPLLRFTGRLRALTLSGFLMVGTVATFFAGSPFRYMKCIGELASIALGAPFTIIHERCLHDAPSITEKQ